MFDSAGVQTLVPGECVQASRSGDDNVGDLSALEQFLILLHGRSTIEHSRAHGRHITRKTTVLVLDLERELARVAKDDHRNFVFRWIELLERGEHKDGSLSVTRFGLAEHVHSENRLRNAFLLNYGPSQQWRLIIYGIVTHPQRDVRNQDQKWLLEALV